MRLSSLTSFFILIVLLSCTDDLSVTPDIQNRNLNVNAIPSLSPVPTSEYVWTLMPNYNDADGAECQTNVNTPTQELSTCRAIGINGEIYAFAGPSLQTQRKFNKTTKQWETFSQTTATTMSRALLQGNYLFSYGNKMYTGLWNEGNHGWYPGIVNSVNHITGAMTEVAPFPGIGTLDFISFAIGNKGYVMGGYTIDTYVMSQQFWEYDFAANTWTDKGTIPGGVRAGGTAIVSGNEVYLGLGYSSLDGDYNNDQHRVYRRDWIKFDPSNATTVTTLLSFPGVRRRRAAGFVLNEKIYLGWGYGRTIGGNPENTDDFWEYNPSTNVWREKAKCPGNIEMKSNRASFVQGNAAYLIIGCYSRLWRYSNTSVVPVPSGNGPVLTQVNP